MVSQKASFRGRCHTCLCKSNKKRKGTVNKTSCSKVCMAGQWSMSERMMVQRVLGRWAMYLIGGNNHMTEGNYRGYPPWVDFLFMFSFLTNGVMVVWCFFHQSRTRWWYNSITWGRLQKRSDSLPHIHCLLVDMKYWGLIDLKDKPFGRWLLIEVQWRIMFIAECCHQRQAARCDAWDPIATEMCCDRMAANTRQWPAIESSGQAHPVSQDKLLSPLQSTFGPPIVREWYKCTAFFYQMVRWIYSHFVYVYTDWHDGGNVPWARQPWQADEWRRCLSIEQFKSKLTELPVGMQPIMIGQRSPRYDTLEKVMTRLDKIFNVMSVMEQITVHVNVIHCACLLNLLQWLLCFHVSCAFE